MTWTRDPDVACPACGGRGWRLDLDEPCSCRPSEEQKRALLKHYEDVAMEARAQQLEEIEHDLDPDCTCMTCTLVHEVTRKYRH